MTLAVAFPIIYWSSELFKGRLDSPSHENIKFGKNKLLFMAPIALFILIDIWK